MSVSYFHNSTGASFNNQAVLVSGSTGVSDITGLQSQLDAKVDDATLTAHVSDAVGGAHTISGILNLQTELDGKLSGSELTTHEGLTDGSAHTISGILNLQTELDGKLSGSELTTHEGLTDGSAHTISGVLNLQSTLDAKVDDATLTAHVADATGSAHTISGVSGLQLSLDAKTPLTTFTAHQVDIGGGAHSISGISGLQAALDGKLDPADLTVHEGLADGSAHTISGVLNLQTTLDGKLDSSELAVHEGTTDGSAHTISGIAGLQTVLDAKVDDAALTAHEANASETAHTISGIAGLAAALAASGNIPEIQTHQVTKTILSGTGTQSVTNVKFATDGRYQISLSINKTAQIIAAQDKTYEVDLTVVLEAGVFRVLRQSETMINSGDFSVVLVAVDSVVSFHTSVDPAFSQSFVVDMRVRSALGNVTFDQPESVVISLPTDIQDLRVWFDCADASKWTLSGSNLVSLDSSVVAADKLVPSLGTPIQATETVSGNAHLVMRTANNYAFWDTVSSSPILTAKAVAGDAGYTVMYIKRWTNGSGDQFPFFFQVNSDAPAAEFTAQFDNSPAPPEVVVSVGGPNAKLGQTVSGAGFYSITLVFNTTNDTRTTYFNGGTALVTNPVATHAAPANSGWDRWYMGSTTFTGAGNTWDGDHGESMIWEHPLTAGEISELHTNYLNAKWNIV